MIQKKKISILSSLCCFTLVSSLVQALPQEVTIVQGNVGVSTENASMVITASDQAILNYSSFNIGANESVKFVQPSSSSVVLNRVVGADPSSILGSLTSNGQVFLVNPNGVYFGADAKVDVGSLIVSTMDIANQDFGSRYYQFNASETKGTISHFGTIHAADGGIVAFISPFIDNQGSITAANGAVEFVAGEKVVVDFSGDGLVSFIVDGKIPEASILQSGQLSATAVKMTLSSVDEVVNRVVNLTGINEGTQLISYNGEIQITNDSLISANQVSISTGKGSEVSVDGYFELKEKEGVLAINTDAIKITHFDVTSSNGSGLIELNAIGDRGGISIDAETRFSTPANYTVAFSTQNNNSLSLADGVEISSLGAALVFNAPIVLNGDHVFIHTNAPSNKIFFNDKVTGDASFQSNFSIDAGRGSIAFARSVGEKVSVGVLDVKAGMITLPEKMVTRGKDMTISAAALFNQDTVLDSTGMGKYEGGNISFSGKRSSIDGDYRFLVEAGKGETQFDGVVGGKSSLQRFHLRSAKTTLKNHVTASGGTIIIDSPCVTVGDLILTDFGPSGIAFLDTLDARNPCVDTLTLLAPMGRVLFSNDVGDTSAYKGIVVKSNTYQQMANLNSQNISVQAPAEIIIAGGTTLNPCSDPGSVNWSNPATINGEVNIISPGGTVTVNGLNGDGTLNVCTKNFTALSAPIEGLGSLEVIGNDEGTIRFGKGAEIDIIGDLILGGEANLIFENRVIDTQGGAVNWQAPLISVDTKTLRAINTRGGPFTYDFSDTVYIGEATYGTNVNTWGGVVRMNSGGTGPCPVGGTTTFIGVVNTGGGDFYAGGGQITLGRSANGGAINTFGGDLTIAGTATNFATMNTGGGAFNAVCGTYDTAVVLGGPGGTGINQECGNDVVITGQTTNLGSDRQVLITEGGPANYTQPVILQTGLYVDLGVGGAAQFSSTIDGPAQLVIVGEEGSQIVFQGNIGSNVYPSAVLVDVEGMVLCETGVGATVAGPISFEADTISLGGVFTDTITTYSHSNGISMNGSLFLSGTATFSTTASNPISFLGTIDSDDSGLNYGLNVDAAGSRSIVTFNDDVGTWMKLGSSSVTAASTRINGAHITVNSQNWMTPLFLVGDSYLKSTAGNITTGNTIDGDFAFNIDAKQSVDIQGVVGGELPLTLFNTKAGTNVTLQANITSYP